MIYAYIRVSTTHQLASNQRFEIVNYANRNDIKIDVIGITVTENEYSKLNCISKAAKGNFFAVNSPDDFEVKFRQAFRSSAPVNVVKSSLKINNFMNNLGAIKYKNFAYEFKN